MDSLLLYRCWERHLGVLETAASERWAVGLSRQNVPGHGIVSVDARIAINVTRNKLGMNTGAVADETKTGNRCCVNQKRMDDNSEKGETNWLQIISSPLPILHRRCKLRIDSQQRKECTRRRFRL